MSSVPPQNEDDASELEAAIDQAIAACDGDQRATIGVLIVTNSSLETEVEELKKAGSHADVRGRFQTYTGQLMRRGRDSCFQLPPARIRTCTLMHTALTSGG